MSYRAETSTSPRFLAHGWADVGRARTHRWQRYSRRSERAYRGDRIPAYSSVRTRKRPNSSQYGGGPAKSLPKVVRLGRLDEYLLSVCESGGTSAVSARAQWNPSSLSEHLLPQRFGCGGTQLDR